ncbi:hypothetical protein SLE2022_144440 [Rubroshorea leprosula]
MGTPLDFLNYLNHDVSLKIMTFLDDLFDIVRASSVSCDWKLLYIEIHHNELGTASFSTGWGCDFLGFLPRVPLQNCRRPFSPARSGSAARKILVHDHSVNLALRSSLRFYASEVV